MAFIDLIPAVIFFELAWHWLVILGRKMSIFCRHGVTIGGYIISMWRSRPSLCVWGAYLCPATPEHSVESITGTGSHCAKLITMDCYSSVANPFGTGEHTVVRWQVAVEVCDATLKCVYLHHECVRSNGWFSLGVLKRQWGFVGMHLPTAYGPKGACWPQGVLLEVLYCLVDYQERFMHTKFGYVGRVWHWCSEENWHLFPRVLICILGHPNGLLPWFMKLSP